jgi:(R,R)-butanediol dehydrogenase / meso-butanediol dehydrogenase / diacetyl reductase
MIEERPDPSPGPGQVLIKVARCGVCGTDLHLTSGLTIGAPADAVLGHEYSGEVIAIGPEVHKLKIGALVTAMPIAACNQCAACLDGQPWWCQRSSLTNGGFAELVTAQAVSTFTLPANLSLQDGALIEPLAVALHGVSIAQMDRGARVLIVGAGPIGLAAVFWARRMGAGAIGVTASTNRRSSLAMAMGANTFIVPGENPAREIREALGGPPDIVFECVGIPGMIAKSVDFVRRRGTVVVLGACMEPDTLTPIRALNKEIKIQFAVVYGRKDFETALDFMDRGHLEPRSMVTDVVSFDEFPAAFEQLRHRTSQCKIMLAPCLLKKL